MSWISISDGGSGDVDILTYDDGLGNFEILMDSNGNVLIGDFL